MSVSRWSSGEGTCRKVCFCALRATGISTRKTCTRLNPILQSQGKTARDVEPLSLEFYLSYAEWFQEQKNIQPLPVYIERLERSPANFVATTLDGDRIHAKQVVLAPGFKHFAHTPDDLKAKLPAGRFKHTAEFVNFSEASNKRYLIIGGRQSAFEWAALLLEAGAAAVIFRTGMRVPPSPWLIGPG